jgi:phage gp46-like protein
MLRLGWSNEVGAGRLQRSDAGALANDASIETLVLLSLFTDVEATPAEIEAAGLDQQRGWWAHADSVRDPETPKMGSKLWLLSREKTTLATIRRAEGYALESLLWLKTQGIAAKIQVVASKPRPGWLGLEVTLTRPHKLLPPFTRLWELRTDALS